MRTLMQSSYCRLYERLLKKIQRQSSNPGREPRAKSPAFIPQVLTGLDGFNDSFGAAMTDDPDGRSFREHFALGHDVEDVLPKLRFPPRAESRHGHSGLPKTGG